MLKIIRRALHHPPRRSLPPALAARTCLRPPPTPPPMGGAAGAWGGHVRACRALAGHSTGAGERRADAGLPGTQGPFLACRPVPPPLFDIAQVPSSLDSQIDAPLVALADLAGVEGDG